MHSLWPCHPHHSQMCPFIQKCFELHRVKGSYWYLIMKPLLDTYIIGNGFCLYLLTSYAGIWEWGCKLHLGPFLGLFTQQASLMLPRDHNPSLSTCHTENNLIILKMQKISTVACQELKAVYIHIYVCCILCMYVYIYVCMHIFLHLHIKYVVYI